VPLFGSTPSTAKCSRRRPEARRLIRAIPGTKPEVWVVARPEAQSRDLSGLTVGARIRAGMVGSRATSEVQSMALPPRFDPTSRRVHDRVSPPPEPSNWRRHGPYLRTLAVALVLTAAAASAGMLMALMGD